MPRTRFLHFLGPNGLSVFECALKFKGSIQTLPYVTIPNLREMRLIVCGNQGTFFDGELVF